MLALKEKVYKVFQDHYISNWITLTETAFLLHKKCIDKIQKHRISNYDVMLHDISLDICNNRQHDI